MYEVRQKNQFFLLLPVNFSSGWQRYNRQHLIDSLQTHWVFYLFRKNYIYCSDVDFLAQKLSLQKSSSSLLTKNTHRKPSRWWPLKVEKIQKWNKFPTKGPKVWHNQTELIFIYNFEWLAKIILHSRISDLASCTYTQQRELAYLIYITLVNYLLTFKH